MEISRVSFITSCQLAQVFLFHCVQTFIFLSLPQPLPFLLCSTSFWSEQPTHVLTPHVPTCANNPLHFRSVSPVLVLDNPFTVSAYKLNVNHPLSLLNWATMAHISAKGQCFSCFLCNYVRMASVLSQHTTCGLCFCLRMHRVKCNKSFPG